MDTPIQKDTRNYGIDLLRILSMFMVCMLHVLGAGGILEAAALCHVTPSHFCKHFKKYTGMTFKEYLIFLRLDYALRLILTTELPITQICIESGFSSPSYFTKAFFKRFGKKPSQLRA